MASYRKMNYLRGLVLCHGKSEVHIVRYISTNLHLSIRCYAKDGGAHSIQITSLMALLKTKPFDSMSSFTKEYDVEIEGKGTTRKLKNFALFAIMDTDDCTPQQKQTYISKEMFRGHWLYDYIVPIYNTENLEDVMVQSGIMPRRVKKGEKGTSYKDYFPVNDKPLSHDTLLDVQTFRNKIEKNRNSNLVVYVDYCLSLLE